MMQGDEFKNKLRGNEYLPEDLSWENTKDGIFTKISTHQKANRRRGGFFLSIILFFSALILGGLLFLASLIHWGPTEEVSTHSIVQEDVNLQINQKEQIINDSNIDAISGILSANSGLSDQSSDLRNYSVNDITSSNQKNNLTLDQIEDSESKILQNNYSNIRSDTVEKIKDDPSVYHNSIVSDLVPGGLINEYVTFNNVDANRSSKKSHSRNQLHIHSIDQKISDPLEYYFELPELYPMFTSVQNSEWEKNSSTPLLISLGVGQNFWLQNFGDSDVSKERDSFEKPIIGHSATLRIGYKISDRISVSSGLDWTKLYSRFDAVFTNQYEELRENQLIEIIHSPYNNQAREVYGDTLVMVTETRTIKHYNSFNQWSIPLIFSYSLVSENWQYGAGFGTIFSIRNTAKGKTINNGELLDYSTDQSIYHKNLGLSILGELHVNYLLTDQISLGLRMGYRQSLKDWSKDEVVSLKPAILNNQLTMGVSF